MAYVRTGHFHSEEALHWIVAQKESTCENHNFRNKEVVDYSNTVLRCQVTAQHIKPTKLGPPLNIPSTLAPLPISFTTQATDTAIVESTRPSTSSHCRPRPKLRRQKQHKTHQHRRAETRSQLPTNNQARWLPYGNLKFSSNNKAQELLPEGAALGREGRSHQTQAPQDSTTSGIAAGQGSLILRKAWETSEANSFHSKQDHPKRRSRITGFIAILI